MPRSNRRSSGPPEDDDRWERFLSSRVRVETRRGREWNVQPLSSTQATKIYRCPGCGLDVGPGVAHLVTWRTDGVLGDAADLADRRHWHSHCWRIS